MLSACPARKNCASPVKANAIKTDNERAHAHANGRTVGLQRYHGFATSPDAFRSAESVLAVAAGMMFSVGEVFMSDGEVGIASTKQTFPPLGQVPEPLGREQFVDEQGPVIARRLQEVW